MKKRKILKILLSIFIISVILVLTVVPCFAVSKGYYSTPFKFSTKLCSFPYDFNGRVNYNYIRFTDNMPYQFYLNDVPYSQTVSYNEYGYNFDYERVFTTVSTDSAYIYGSYTLRETTQNDGDSTTEEDYNNLLSSVYFQGFFFEGLQVLRTAYLKNYYVDYYVYQTANSYSAPTLYVYPEMYKLSRKGIDSRYAELKQISYSGVNDYQVTALTPELISVSGEGIAKFRYYLFPDEMIQAITDSADDFFDGSYVVLKNYETFLYNFRNTGLSDTVIHSARSFYEIEFNYPKFTGEDKEIENLSNLIGNYVKNFSVENKEIITIGGTDWTSWLSSSVSSILNANLFGDINFTIGNLLLIVISVGIFLIFLKIFAGG